ncbi:MAG: NAD(P)H-quinone oxidoreductase subunit 6 [Clostridia bacterium]|jgi:NADH-quinone oxidoreductase subunit J|nr:NAD(P)H-quinone oxidoreductase subunit 6 [Clostridia bacterium]MDN5322732.1 NAD(P)H-quinone oxidoreductase subunit 6 [Clostridia bacterium]
MDYQVIAFWLLSFITLGSALSVVFFTNIVHSALALIVTFLGIAGIYLTLHADFLAAVQVLVYAGAISILIVFGIMLITRGDGKMAETNLFGKYKYTAAIVVTTLFGVISYFIIRTPWSIETAALSENTIGDLAEILLADYVIPFELAAILLTVAMVGAIVIAREVKNPK